MNAEDFEKRLKRQLVRPLPSEWRAEILSAAQRAARPERAPRSTPLAPPSLFSALRAQAQALLWPHPAAWAGLAAVWLAIGGLNLSAPQTAPSLARRASPLTSQVCFAFQDQARLLSELIGPAEPPAAERPKHVLPRPRTERQTRLLMA